MTLSISLVNFTQQEKKNKKNILITPSNAKY